MLELRERVVAAAAAAAEARLEMQRVVDGRREELLSRVAGLPCTLGDLVYMAWLYAFMLGLDQVGGGCCGRRRSCAQVQLGCFDGTLPPRQQASGRIRSPAPPPALPSRCAQLLLVAGTLESARAQRRDYLGGWLQMWRQLRVQK